MLLEFLDKLTQESYCIKAFRQSVAKLLRHYSTTLKQPSNYKDINTQFVNSYFIVFLQLIQCDFLGLFTMALRVCFLLFEGLHTHLKFQMEVCKNMREVYSKTMTKAAINVQCCWSDIVLIELLFSSHLFTETTYASLVTSVLACSAGILFGRERDRPLSHHV